MARPIRGIRPFKGRAAKWLAGYLATHRPDPEEAARRRERDRAVAGRIKRRGTGMAKGKPGDGATRRGDRTMRRGAERGRGKEEERDKAKEEDRRKRRRARENV